MPTGSTDALAPNEAMPWIGSGPIYACNERSAGTLVEALRRLGFDVVELEGERIVNHESFTDLFTYAFGFPAASANGWQSLAEVPTERLTRPPGERVAIVWRRADHSATFCLKCVVEACAFLLGWGRALERSDAVPTRRLDVFLLGQTRDFAQPPPGWTLEGIA
ncbi:MAG TPA: hypothetical protein VG709_06640 [Actinomycetota bacterium]|nr:hypothetical protein [Actinomycetota bacterium]